MSALRFQPRSVSSGFGRRLVDRLRLQFRCDGFQLAEGRHYTVKVVSIDQQQDITDVIEPSVAFSYDGLEFAVHVFMSGDGCIAIYDVLDDANSLLRNRRDIF